MRNWTKPPDELGLRMRAWENFIANPAADVSALVRQHVGVVDTVVDAGCGGGHELLPYLCDARGVGIDVDLPTLRLARDLLRDRHPAGRLVLTCAAVEALPLRSCCADVVISRLVLHRVDNRRALAEMARVLRRGGGLVVTFHHPRYYLRKLRDGWRQRDLRPMVHATRIALTGLYFHVVGTQRSILGMRDTYLTRAHLTRIAAEVGLELAAELPAGSAATPSLLFIKVPPLKKGD